MKMPLSVYNKKTTISLRFKEGLGSDSDRNFSDIIFTFIKI